MGACRHRCGDRAGAGRCRRYRALAERAIRRGQLLTEQLQGALDSRIVIEQAKGAIVQARGVSVDEAFTLIRGYSRSHNLRLSDVARTVTTDLSAIPDLANPQTCPVSLRGSVSRRPQ